MCEPGSIRPNHCAEWKRKDIFSKRSKGGATSSMAARRPAAAGATGGAVGGPGAARPTTGAEPRGSRRSPGGCQINGTQPTCREGWTPARPGTETRIGPDSRTTSSRCQITSGSSRRRPIWAEQVSCCSGVQQSCEGEGKLRSPRPRGHTCQSVAACRHRDEPSSRGRSAHPPDQQGVGRRSISASGGGGNNPARQTFEQQSPRGWPKGSAWRAAGGASARTGRGPAPTA